MRHTSNEITLTPVKTYNPYLWFAKNVRQEAITGIETRKTPTVKKAYAKSKEEYGIDVFVGSVCTLSILGAAILKPVVEKDIGGENHPFINLFHITHLALNLLFIYSIYSAVESAKLNSETQNSCDEWLCKQHSST